jgi:hypothetical protein
MTGATSGKDSTMGTTNENDESSMKKAQDTSNNVSWVIGMFFFHSVDILLTTFRYSTTSTPSLSWDDDATSSHLTVQLVQRTTDKSATRTTTTPATLPLYNGYNERRRPKTHQMTCLGPIGMFFSSDSFNTFY